MQVNYAHMITYICGFFLPFFQ